MIFEWEPYTELPGFQYKKNQRQIFS